MSQQITESDVVLSVATTKQIIFYALTHGTILFVGGNQETAVDILLLRVFLTLAAG